MKRTDDLGRAFAGSQLQVQIYVARRQTELSAAVLDALRLTQSATDIHWTAPLEHDRFLEPYDGSFLKALGLAENGEELARFWPPGGPHGMLLPLTSLSKQSLPL